MLRVTQSMRSGSALPRLLNRAPQMTAAPALLLTTRRDAATMVSGRSMLSNWMETPSPAPKKSFATRGLSTSAGPLTEADVLACQSNWASAICEISSVYLAKGDYVATAGEWAGELYGYGHADVLFKPTKAMAHPFRPTAQDAMSYFVGAGAMKNLTDDVFYDAFVGEDFGFAINGGRGWSNVVFNNHNIVCFADNAIAMGSYDFTDATSRRKTTVEYTFGYRRNDDGKIRIFLHHSSMPFSPTGL